MRGVTGGARPQAARQALVDRRGTGPERAPGIHYAGPPLPRRNTHYPATACVLQS